MRTPREIEKLERRYNPECDLVKEGRTYAFPSSDPLEPILKATVYCTAEERTQAIPLGELREIFAESERTFMAALN